MAKIEKDYYKIREVLLSLLCVGNNIKFLHHITGLGLTLTKHTITEVSEKEIRLESYHYSAYRLCSIECYQGELYIWTEEEEEYSYRSRERIIRMAELIKNVETITYDFTIE